VRKSGLHNASTDHFTKTASALILNTAGTSALGLLYWIIVARLYSPATLARNSALISAMLTLSGVAQLNMGLGLGAILPRGGNQSRRLLAEAYVVVTLFSVAVLAIALLLVLPSLHSLAPLLHISGVVPIFIATVFLYNIFALQDAALSAFRSAQIVPIENALFGLAKIVLAVLFVSSDKRIGIFLSWALPLAFLVVPISSYLFAKVASRQRDAPVGATRLADLTHLLALDYVGYLFFVSSTLALPVLALALVGPHDAAIFSVCWLTSSTLDLIAINIGTAFTVEGSHSAALIDDLRRRVLTAGLPLVAALSLAAAALAPLILDLFGGEYATHGAVVLRVLVLAAAPRAVSVFAMSQARADRRMGFILRTQAISAVLVVGGSILLTPTLGVLGMALAWTAAQVLVCLTVLPYLLSQRTWPSR